MSIVTSIVFFAHFRADGRESHRIERVSGDKTASDFFEWVIKENEKLDILHGKEFVIVTCKIIR